MCKCVVYFCRYPQIVLRYLKYLPLKESVRLHKSCLLMYLHYMIHLYRLSNHQISKMRSE